MMFSGIVEEVGIVKQREATGLAIEAYAVLEGISVKESIAVDGACLTITGMGEGWFGVDTMPETLRRTRLGSLQVGDPVNLERAVAVNGRMGGHIVQGHIEACVPVISIKKDGVASYVEVELSEQLRLYVVAKGFIAVNGVSLTVITCKRDLFSFALIPYTQEHTNLGSLEVGTLLNLETDIMGRYLVQLLQREREMGKDK